MRWIGLLTWIAVMVVAPVAHAGETTTYRGDSTHLAAIDDPSIVPPFSVAWTRDLKTGFYATPPLVVDGRVFTANYGTLFALDAATGDTLWQQEVDRASFPGYGAGRLFTFGDDGMLRAFDPATGTLLWSRQLPWSARTYPVIAGGHLYVQGSATLWQFDPATGADLWRAGVSQVNEATPAVDGSTVIADDGTQGTAFGVGDGRQLWQFDSHYTGGGAETVAVHDGRVFSYSMAQRLGHVLDEATGTLLRTFPGSEPPAIAGGLAIFPTTDGTLVAQNEATGQTRWEVATGVYLRTPFVVADVAYATYGPNGLMGVHISDGSAAWCDHPTEQAGEVTAGDGILLWSSFGRLVAYRHDPSAPLPAGCPGNPASPPAAGTPPASGTVPPTTDAQPANTPETSEVKGSGTARGSVVLLGPVRKGHNCQLRRQLPDRRCTPGAILRAVTTTRICAPGYSGDGQQLSRSRRRAVYRAYNLAWAHGKIDYLVPPELGGASVQANLYPQPAHSPSSSHPKSRLENALHREVCSGRLRLRTAQERIARNWLKAYRSRFHRT